MEQEKIREQMLRYNSLYKEMDDVYHSLANHYSMSDTTLWLLYILRESDVTLTQRDVCEKLSLSKQTINSALKNLEKAGLVILQSPTGNQKNKQIYLTQEGQTLARQTVDHVLDMEENAFKQFTNEERNLFLQLNEKYVILLEQEAKKLLYNGREED